MDYFVFGFYIDIGRPLDGFISVGIFAITEDYARARANGMIRDSFPNHKFKSYSDMDEWVAACASSLQDTEKMVGTYQKEAK